MCIIGVGHYKLRKTVPVIIFIVKTNVKCILCKIKFTIRIQKFQRNPPSNLRERTRKVSIKWCVKWLSSLYY